MPARSTPFQSLVAHIQTRLSLGASVEESAMLRHRITGDDREVDVVIRSMVGEHAIVVSVECIDQSRPADTTWIEQMKTKHDHLETDRLVLVSRSGFYEPARKLAESLGISTYTPEEAVRQDWMRLVGDGRDFGLRFRWNQREERWYLDLRDGAGSLIAAGMKLVCNWPLLRYKKWDPRTPPGELVVVTLSPDRSPPGVDELGVGLRCELTYLAVSG